MNMNRFLGCGLVLAMALLAGRAFAAGSAYDPLAVPESFEPQTLDLSVHDAARNRDIPILVYLPEKTEAAPVVLFSHGLGGSRQGSAFLARYWAGRGYVAVFLQHPGSDTSVWQDKPREQRMAAMRQAANTMNFILRVKDVPAVLDQLERWNSSPDHALAGRLDLKRIAMTGHSFGAVTTQAVSGQSTKFKRISFTEPRIKVAIAFSPSCPQGSSPEQAFGGVKIPWLLMTGTKDAALIGNIDVESRLAVFPALPPGGKYELVLDGAEHSAFTDRALPGESGKRNPNHHRAILALSTAFLDACLCGDPAAKAWLDGDGPASILEPKDRWQQK